MADLESDDFKQIFSVAPNIKKIVLGNACQFKNETMAYMIEKAHNIVHLHLYAANLISDETWSTFFRERGSTLQALQLTWLDAAFEDAQVSEIAKFCPNLTRLKLKRCRRLTPACFESIAKMKKLEHLSLQLSLPVPNDDLTSLIRKRGAGLQTLSLQTFSDIDDPVLVAIRKHCHKLRKLRINDNDTMTDAALASLFQDWSNPPLRFADFSATRDVDNSNPDGPEDAPLGLGAESFPALMNHSGTKLEYLNISSCRHITFDALGTIFDGTKQYPEIREIDLSFVSAVDTVILAGLFKSAPKLQRVVAFGCFGVGDEVVVPRGVVVLGLPRAQDAIERFGEGVDADVALERMVEAMGVLEEEEDESMEVDG
jgi:DNA repair protein RAD7